MRSMKECSCSSFHTMKEYSDKGQIKLIELLFSFFVLFLRFSLKGKILFYFLRELFL